MSKRVAVVLVCALAAASAIPPAAATDDPVQTLSVYDLNSSFVEVGIDDAGNATAAWVEAGALNVARRAATGKFVEPQTIAVAHVSDASLDVAPNGAAVIAVQGAMVGGELVVAVRKGPRADFGPLQVLVREEDPSRVSEVEAKISPAGRAVVVWTTADTTGQPNRIMGALSDDGGEFGIPEAVASGAGLSGPQVDVDAAGRALAVWDHTEASATDDVMLAAAGTTGGFGDPRVLETLEQGPGAPDVAVSSSGDAVVAHVDFTSEGEGNSRDKVETRYGDVTGTFGGSQTPTDVSTPTAASEVEVAIDDSGRAAVIASLAVEGEYGLYAAVSDASGTFATASMQAVSPHPRVTGPGIPRSSYAIAAGGGEFTAFWVNDHDDDESNEVWTATTASGAFGAAHQLSPESTDSPERAHGARSADGDVVAGWLLFDEALRAQGPTTSSASRATTGSPAAEAATRYPADPAATRSWAGREPTRSTVAGAATPAWSRAAPRRTGRSRASGSGCPSPRATPRGRPWPPPRAAASPPARRPRRAGRRSSGGPRGLRTGPSGRRRTGS